jgi:hypothetical protein
VVQKFLPVRSFFLTPELAEIEVSYFYGDTASSHPPTPQTGNQITQALATIRETKRKQRNLYLIF